MIQITALMDNKMSENKALINEHGLSFLIEKDGKKILFDTGKIRGDVYNSTCQDYAFAVGQAQTSLIMPTIDEMESITNSWNTLIPRVTEHKMGFINNGSKEILKVQ